MDASRAIGDAPDPLESIQGRVVPLSSNDGQVSAMFGLAKPFKENRLYVSDHVDMSDLLKRSNNIYFLKCFVILVSMFEFCQVAGLLSTMLFLNIDSVLYGLTIAIYAAGKCIPWCVLTWWYTAESLPYKSLFSLAIVMSAAGLLASFFTLSKLSTIDSTGSGAPRDNSDRNISIWLISRALFGASAAIFEFSSYHYAARFVSAHHVVLVLSDLVGYVHFGTYQLGVAASVMFLSIPIGARSVFLDAHAAFNAFTLPSLLITLLVGGVYCTASKYFYESGDGRMLQSVQPPCGHWEGEQLASPATPGLVASSNSVGLMGDALRQTPLSRTLLDPVSASLSPAATEPVTPSLRVPPELQTECVWHTAIHTLVLGIVLGLLWLLPLLALALSQAQQLVEARVLMALQEAADRTHLPGSDDHGADLVPTSVFIGSPRDMWKVFLGFALGQIVAKVLSSKCCCAWWYRYRFIQCHYYSVISMFAGLLSVLLSSLFLLIVAARCQHYSTMPALAWPDDVDGKATLSTAAHPRNRHTGDLLTRLEQVQLQLTHLVGLFLTSTVILGIGTTWFAGSHLKLHMMQLHRLVLQGNREVRICPAFRGHHCTALFHPGFISPGLVCLL